MSVHFREMDLARLKSERRACMDSSTMQVVSKILSQVQSDPGKLLHYARELDDLRPDEPLVYRRADLERDYRGLKEADRALLERVHQRIQNFARAQRACVQDLDVSIEGGRAGHRFLPHRSAGCYAPGGRFPLPSSVLMTVVPAKVAGVPKVWVASPRPAPILRAAAFLAGADALLAAGGAQAIGALAYGVGPVPACDIIVGPGNRFVTAAKHLVQDRVAIDMLAGPSELVVLADHSADPDLVACDLLAQAEHDPEAWPVLLCTDLALVERVKARLSARLESLPTAAIASQALRNGGFCLARSREELVRLSDSLEAEHVQILMEKPQEIAGMLRRYGALFVGSASAEAMGDYGAGPNHVLPTGGGARTRGGLSVMDFLSLRTFMELSPRDTDFARVVSDTEILALHEGLDAHALSARVRLQDPPVSG